MGAHRERQQALDEELGRPAGDLVFRRIDGSPLRPDTVTHAFADLVKKAGVPHVRLHDLRHTHATLMMEQGINPKIVSERLGEASFAITLDLYGHVSPGHRAEPAQRFDQALAKQSEVEAKAVS
jgi:integrase